MNLIQMSTAGAVLILAIIVIRTLMIHILPKRTFTLLWTIALLRLVIPISIPSTLSIYDWLVNNQSVQNFTAGSPIATLLPISADTAGDQAIFSINVNHSMLAFIWAAGAVICAVFFAVTFCISLRKFNTSLPVANCITDVWLKTHKLCRTITVRQSDLILSPMTYGVFHPVILFPKRTDWENHKQLSFIFEHEYAHIRRFDSVKKLLLISVACIHWFNPATWAMYILFNRDMELACDEEVLRKTGIQARGEYATALINMEEQRSYPALLNNYFSKSAVEERITAIMKHKCDSYIYRLISVTLVLCICLCFATSAKAVVPGEAMGSKDPILNAQTSEWVWPTNSKTVTLSFGEHTHPVSGESYYCDHITIKGIAGEPVVSAVSGTITAAGYDPIYGNFIVISGNEQIRTVYGHLMDLYETVGTSVNAGQQIGRIGATGSVTGNCLSFAVFFGDEVVDPLRYYNQSN